RKEGFDTSSLPERVADQFARSQLLVRTQIDNGGAIIAANDSDIQQFGGDHYSYCWMRDGALVAEALIETGQSELSRNFFRFAERCIEDAGYFLHKYTPAGHLASSWHPWTLEGQQVLPIQQDETALVTWALRRHFETFRDVEFIKPLYERLVVKPAEWMLSYRDASGLPKQSWDLWEERRGVHTFTCASTIGALLAAADFAEDFGERDRAARYRQGAERMKSAVRQILWSPSEGRFARMAIPGKGGGYELDMTADSANYALFAIANFDPRDPAIVSEMTHLRERLSCKTPVGGCARYEHDYYHQVEKKDIESVPGNPWIICTLWHALYAIDRAVTIDELDEAVPIMEWACDRAHESGVLAEQYDPHTGEPLSVSPLTWSHATFAVVCARYIKKRAALLSGGRREPALASTTA
ncbi:MAG: glycoside hydrolase family 15 protein, partial [Planctomycetota bacterium]